MSRSFGPLDIPHGDTRAVVEMFPVAFTGFPYPCLVVTKGVIAGSPVWRAIVPVLNPEDDTWARGVAQRIAKILDEEGAPL